jgi:hypothetical protein
MPTLAIYNITEFAQHYDQLIYYPQSQFRWTDLMSDNQLDRSSFSFLYQKNDQSIHKLYINPGDLARIKVYFANKNKFYQFWLDKNKMAATFVRTIDPVIDLTDNVAPRQIVAGSPQEFCIITYPSKAFSQAISTGTLFLRIHRLLLQDTFEFRLLMSSL